MICFNIDLMLVIFCKYSPTQFNSILPLTVTVTSNSCRAEPLRQQEETASRTRQIWAAKTHKLDVWQRSFSFHPWRIPGMDGWSVNHWHGWVTWVPNKASLLWRCHPWAHWGSCWLPYLSAVARNGPLKSKLPIVPAEAGILQLVEGDRWRVGRGGANVKVWCAPNMEEK